MKKAVLTLSALVVLGLVAGATAREKKEASEVPAALNFEMKSLMGKPIKLSDYAGKVVLVVNVASKCGLTPQYKALQELHEKYGAEGLTVLGFPANEFGKQEPGSDEEIASFCQANYGVEFDMFSKVVVKGDGICPLYEFLTSEETNPNFAGEISWNFEKFLIAATAKSWRGFHPESSPRRDAR